MNIVEKILESIETDDSNTESESETIQLLYESATDKEKQKIDMIFISLCGWSLKTLINDVT